MENWRELHRLYRTWNLELKTKMFEENKTWVRSKTTPTMLRRDCTTLTNPTVATEEFLK
jgi:hypothetical protein